MKLKKFNEMIENTDPTGLNTDGTYANPNGKTLAEKYGIVTIYSLDVTNLPQEIDDELEEKEVYTHDQTNEVFIDGKFPVFYKFLKDVGLEPNYGKAYRICVSG